MTSLCPRSVLITGANRGLGLEFVRQFLKLPKPPQILIATCRDPEKAESLQDLASQNSSVQILKLDVGDKTAVENVKNEVDNILQGQGLNFLLNNAGIHIRKGLNETDGDMLMENYRINVVAPFVLIKVYTSSFETDSKNTKDFDNVQTRIKSQLSENGLNLLINNAAITFQKQYLGNNSRERLLESFDVNVVGPLLIVQTFLPLLKKAASTSSLKGLCCNKAAIINITSTLGSIESNKTGGLYPYRSSKAALNMVTKSLSVDLLGDEILATSIHPGWVQTDMGGPNATLQVAESIEGCLRTFASFDNESTGLVYDYTGKVLPY